MTLLLTATGDLKLTKHTLININIDECVNDLLKRSTDQGDSWAMVEKSIRLEWLKSLHTKFAKQLGDEYAKKELHRVEIDSLMELPHADTERAEAARVIAKMLLGVILTVVSHNLHQAIYGGHGSSKYAFKSHHSGDTLQIRVVRG